MYNILTLFLQYILSIQINLTIIKLIIRLKKQNSLAQFYIQDEETEVISQIMKLKIVTMSLFHLIVNLDAVDVNN